MGDMRFNGRVAVITGGGRGLGREYALLLASRGAKIVVNDPGSAIKGDGIDAGPAQAVAEEIRSVGGQAVANTDTVATEAGGAAIIQAAIDAWGRIDILIHNAGNVRYGSLKEISHEDFRAVVDVHFMGAFNVVRPAFPLMCAANYGRVVLTSSIGGVYGNENVINYAMSKTGMIGLNNVIALEGEAEGVKSNIILPGAVTRMAERLDITQYPPMGPELVAPMVGWLAHEACSVSGEIMAAVGGRMARAFVAETPGVYRPSWTIDDIAAHIEDIRAKGPENRDILDFGLHGHVDHLTYSFGKARKG